MKSWFTVLIMCMLTACSGARFGGETLSDLVQHCIAGRRTLKLKGNLELTSHMGTRYLINASVSPIRFAFFFASNCSSPNWRARRPMRASRSRSWYSRSRRSRSLAPSSTSM